MGRLDAEAGALRNVLPLGLLAEPISLLCLGAHPDDIEIGAGGTVLQLARNGRLGAVNWVVFSGTPERVREGRAAAEAFLTGATRPTVAFHDLRDGYFPAQFAEVKDVLETIKATARPDLVLMPRARDAHQDHRLVAELARTTFRDHLLLEYEIAKYDGDLQPPNAYVALDEAVLARKIEIILASFGSQRGRTWFDAEAFRGLARIRGIEAGGGARYAEAYHANKVLLAVGRPVDRGAADGRDTEDPTARS